MITIQQSRAARGLLGWTQQELADAAGLSKTAINNFEKDKSAIKMDSLKAIQMAFEALGVEFIGDTGVRLSHDRTEVLRGPLAFQLLLEDIRTEINTAQYKDIMVLNAQKTHIEALAKLHSDNTPVRFLHAKDISADAANEHLCNSITCDAEQNAPTTFVFADKVALQLFGSEFILLMKNKDAYTAERKRFEILWKENREKKALSKKRATH